VEVLKQIKEGERKPTRIMYSANLSWKSLKEIISSLVDQGLIYENIMNRGRKRTKRRYEITPKGENVLQYYNVVSDLIEIEATD
jgi:predicted transcriptional regulator